MAGPGAWLRGLFGSKPTPSGDERPSNDPTPQDWEAAKRALRDSLRPAVPGVIGGRRPDPPDAVVSRWGGPVLGPRGAVAPTGRSGQAMVPVLQVRGDAFPAGLLPDDIRLLILWLDLANPDVTIFSPIPAGDFAIQTYDDTDDLVPIPHDGSELKPFPVDWGPVLQQQPGWEDMAFRVPGQVARASASDWFFESPEAVALSEVQQTSPIKLGGWPTWIQGAQWPGDSDFIFQVDSTDKGRFFVGDSGSIYVFRNRKSGEWSILTDFY